MIEIFPEIYICRDMFANCNSESAGEDCMWNPHTRASGNYDEQRLQEGTYKSQSLSQPSVQCERM